MPIFDTFETEPISSYSGSYISNYYAYLDSTVNSNGIAPVGSYFSSRAGTNASGRGKIFDLASRQKTSYYGEVEFDLETYLKINNINYIGRPQKFVNFFSEDEFYFDSVMPYPFDIHTTNGAKSVFSDVTYTLLGNRIGHTLYLTLGTELTASNDFVNIADKKWIFSFPFSSKYKNLKRLINNTTIEQTIEYYPSGIFGSETPKQNVEWQVWKYGTGTNPGILPSPIKTTTPQFFVAWLVPSQSFPNGTLSESGSLFSTDRNLNNTFIIPWNRKIKNNIFTDTIENLTLESQYNSYFGFGNSSRYKLPSYVEQTNLRSIFPIFPITTGSNGQSILKLGIGTLLRGYKYGIISANLLKTKNVFRTGKFGQFRDMLEQRPNTQFIIKGNFFSSRFFPIDVTFVTGSTIYTQAIDYVTATNPSYNPYDSGIYDYHYRSGQPFTDR